MGFKPSINCVPLIYFKQSSACFLVTYSTKQNPQGSLVSRSTPSTIRTMGPVLENSSCNCSSLTVVGRIPTYSDVDASNEDCTTFFSTLPLTMISKYALLD